MNKVFSALFGTFSLALTLSVFALGTVAIADTVGWRFHPVADITSKPFPASTIQAQISTENTSQL